MAKRSIQLKSEGELKLEFTTTPELELELELEFATTAVDCWWVVELEYSDESSQRRGRGASTRRVGVWSKMPEFVERRNHRRD
eukprot:CAMPEP_0184358476 /NCGR_PEP_ID=MMETSP1089-20130417/114929_1 /TAXON_ID=38269 ORGANISM="Gloeochaete wittrockiana, Strain SAG46.84" /NCGR_SAMPLE_ID=MMETSP1089 /ASSEMBLY_ACC=CAM_ASM_000445 /LENGTH=82 /DNA_ID=CAMNT_0026696835 /DNA_START=37 /DNA_END=286 /DNA_ORIENTATION=-